MHMELDGMYKISELSSVFKERFENDNEWQSLLNLKRWADIK